MKDAQLKIAWCSLLNGDTAKYLSKIAAIRNIGTMDLDADKRAQEISFDKSNDFCWCGKGFYTSNDINDIIYQSNPRLENILLSETDENKRTSHFNHVEEHEKAPLISYRNDFKHNLCCCSWRWIQMSA